MPHVLRRTSSIQSTVSAAPSYATVDPSPSRSSTNTAPPAFSAADFPSKYHVGAYKTLFVTVEEVQAHLKLLAAFHQLRQRVEALKGGQWPDIDPKARWALFVHCAVERFDRYIDTLIRRTPEESGVPPLDVVLVFHSYLLNPARFAEDCQRIVQLNRMKDLVLGRMAGSINPTTLEHETPAWAEADWETRTMTSYDPFLQFEMTKGFKLRLPGQPKYFFVPWLTADGTGYAQQGFKFSAPDRQVWTHESLGILKLYSDINDVRLSAAVHALSGTVITTHDPARAPTLSQRAKYVNSRLKDLTPVKIMTSAENLGRMIGYKRESAKVMLTLALKKPQGVEKILACYTRGERFSLDLASAVLRQGVFIDKMHSLGWLEPGRFENDVTILHRCIARYHAFQDLLASKNSMFCVPTLDIDLAWHTHQLKGTYALDVVAHTLRFIDHDDRVEEGTLANGFDQTARAWQARFGVPYSTCGCPLPSAPPLSRLSRAFGRSSTTPHYSASLLSTSLSLSPSDAAEETHASEHNSIVLPSNPEAQKRRRAREVDLEARRRKQEREWEKERRKGGGVAKGEKGEDVEGGGKRGVHPAAFLAPLALVPVFGVAGYLLPPGGGCCSYDVNQAGGPNGKAAACGGRSGACASIGSTSCDGASSSCGGGSSSGGGDGGGGGGGGDGGGGGGCGGGCGGGGD